MNFVIKIKIYSTWMFLTIGNDYCKLNNSTFKHKLFLSRSYYYRYKNYYVVYSYCLSALFSNGRSNIFCYFQLINYNWTIFAYVLVITSMTTSVYYLLKWSNNQQQQSAHLNHLKILWMRTLKKLLPAIF